MIPLLTRNRDKIAALCERYAVQKLEVFGSAVGDHWDPTRSDLDFIVDMGDYGEGVGFRYLGFARELEELLGRSVDLMTDDPIKNPYLRQAVNKQRTTIFESQDRQTAA